MLRFLFLLCVPSLYLLLTLSFCLHSHCIHQILDSVSYTHQHDIVHRDLKVCVRVCLLIALLLSAPHRPLTARGGGRGVALLMLVFLMIFFFFSCL